jgi:transglutaminase-like putative cysteine protease
MIKRVVSVLFVLVFFMGSLGQAFGSSLYSISILSNNEIKIESAKYGSDMRVMVEKGNDKYYYSLNSSEEQIPAQLGAGTYLVKILQNTDGNKYKVVDKSYVNIKNNSIDVFLSSSQPIYWENRDKLLKLAQELTKDLETDKEKIEAVHTYIVKNIKYDYNKINNISTDYVPDIEEVIDSKKGICYDYASLFAGILRSQGIHTKLIKGYKNDLNSYHAWNEVLMDGEWVVIDTTYDAAFRNVNTQSMVKQSNEYNKVREY